jgi:hypothetical protein
MSDRSLLGAADVTDAELARMVADLHGRDPGAVAVLESAATEVPYELPALTTAGRYWVTGTARYPDGIEPFRLFVKHLQSWARSPFFELVPPEMRELAAASVPWRTEALVYTSDLRDRLPDGLTMPRAVGVFHLDEHSAAVWLEEVAHRPVPWDLRRFRRAAYLLGRLAASPRVAELARIGDFEWSVRSYLHGRLENQVFPALRDDASWQHPAVAAAVDPGLRDRLVTAVDEAERYVEELDAVPLLTAHGDACPNNLLTGPVANGFVLIDYGFWLPNPLGFDLGQLVVGDVQLGRRSPALLAETDEACVTSYVEGLAAEGVRVDEATVRRAHALQLMLFTGYSALPLDELDGLAPQAQRSLVVDRAVLARFCLDLVDSTEPG